MINDKFKVLTSVLAGIICLFVSASPLSASSSQTLQVDATSYVISTQWLSAWDEAGHVVGMQQREGEAVFSNGETADYSTVSTFDSRRGKNGGTSRGYSKFTFSDGSLIIFSWTADITRADDGLSCNQGEGTIIKGTGRFEGIMGKSVFSGRQLRPSSEDPRQASVQNATITYTLP